MKKWEKNLVVVGAGEHRRSRKRDQRGTHGREEDTIFRFHGNEVYN